MNTDRTSGEESFINEVINACASCEGSGGRRELPGPGCHVGTLLHTHTCTHMSVLNAVRWIPALWQARCGFILRASGTREVHKLPSLRPTQGSSIVWLHLSPRYDDGGTMGVGWIRGLGSFNLSSQHSLPPALREGRWESWDPRLSAPLLCIHSGGHRHLQRALVAHRRACRM